MSTPFFPQLSFDTNGSHDCVGCDLCVSVCPSRCLSILAEGEGNERVVIRFNLTRGACIGCGLCRDVCPGGAIEMVAGMTVELAPLSGPCGVVDLLVDPAAKWN